MAVGASADFDFMGFESLGAKASDRSWQMWSLFHVVVMESGNSLILIVKISNCQFVERNGGALILTGSQQQTHRPLSSVLDTCHSSPIPSSASRPARQHRLSIDQPDLAQWHTGGANARRHDS